MARERWLVVFQEIQSAPCGACRVLAESLPGPRGRDEVPEQIGAVGIVATIGANLAHGLNHGPVGALVRFRAVTFIRALSNALLDRGPAAPPWACRRAWRTVAP
jgi:hypothetical protein